MRTPENKKSKKTSPEVKTRKLKIHYQIRYSRRGYKTVPHEVPEIKLCGKWLQELGFEHGKDVLITLQNKRLIIEPVSVG